MRETGLLEILSLLGSLSLIFLWSVQGMKKTQRKREMEHAERLKSLEMGLTLQPNRLDWPSASVCIAVGAGVPLSAFLVTWLATMTAEVPSQIWLAPVVVSYLAVRSTEKLALRIIEPKGKDRRVVRDQSRKQVEKPAFDPDAYDVVGSRG